MLAVMIMPFRRHSKGLSAVTALIDSIMKLSKQYLAVTKDNILLVHMKKVKNFCEILAQTRTRVVSRVHI